MPNHENGTFTNRCQQWTLCKLQHKLQNEQLLLSGGCATQKKSESVSLSHLFWLRIPPILNQFGWGIVISPSRHRQLLEHTSPEWQEHRHINRNPLQFFSNPTSFKIGHTLYIILYIHALEIIETEYPHIYDIWQHLGHWSSRYVITFNTIKFEKHYDTLIHVVICCTS